jgi:hypothetical protein
MQSPSAHRKLVNLLCLFLLTIGGLVGLAACGGVLPVQQDEPVGTFQTYDQVVESFGQIVPGMTQAQDLPNLGFDTKAGDLLPSSGIGAWLLPAAGTHRLSPAVRDCLRARLYCNAYVFYPSRAGSKPVLFGLGGSSPWAAQITLLVMNGRVIHKVLSGSYG